MPYNSNNTNSTGNSMTPLLGAGISTAGNILGSIFGNIGAKKRQKQANKDNIKFWNMQNQYNSPTSQMERLRQAGLNPNLIYGSSPSGASGNAQQIAPSKPAPYSIDNPLQNMTQFADLKQKEAQTDNLKTLNTVIEQDKQLRVGQTKGQNISNKYAPELAQSSLQVQEAQVKQMYASTIGNQINNQINDATKGKQIEQIGQTLLNAKSNLTGIELSNAIKQFETSLNAIGLTKTDSQIIRAMYMNYGKIKKANQNQIDNNKRLKFINK